MDPIYKPLSQEEKAQLEKRGYKQWEYFGIPKYADPDSTLYHFSSMTIFILSILGRQYCRKHGHAVYGFNINIAMIPVFYFFAFRKKHLDKSLDAVTRRPSFNDVMEFYPVTRRAWKRALLIREKEMEEIKSRVENI